MTKFRLSLDLQHFAEGGEPAASSEPAAPVISSPADPLPAATPDEPVFAFTPNWGLPKDQAAAPQVNQTPPVVNAAPAVPPAQPAKEVIDFAGRKVEVTDPAILAVLRDVHKDYTSLQGTYTKSSQELQELRTANQTYEQRIQALQQQPPAATPPAAATPPQDQALASLFSEGMTAEDFMEKLYDSPVDLVKSVVQSMLDQQVKPVIEPITKEREAQEKEREMTTQISELTTKHSDFNDHIGAMQEVLKEMPQLVAHGLETVYHVAKGRSTQQAQTPAAVQTPEQMLADPQFQQHVLANPQIQQQMISQYLQGKVQTQQLAPPVMGASGGGQSPSIPEQRPTNLRDASKAFLKHMGW